MNPIMKSRFSTNSNLGYLILLIAIAGCLRFWSISYGLPAVYNSTEYFIAKHALSLGARKTLEPLFFIYPTFYTYFMATVYGVYYLVGSLAGWFANPSDFALQFLLDPTPFYLLGRLINGVAIILSAVVIYQSSRFFLSAVRSFLIALLLLSSITVFEFTFWMVPDAFLVLGTTLVCYFILKGSQRGISGLEIIIASLVCGLTISSKYNAGFLASGWLVYLWFFSAKNSFNRYRSAVLALGFLLLGFLLGSPYWLLAFSKFWAGFKMILSQSRYASNVETGPPYGWELQNIVTGDWLLGIMIVLFLAVLLRRMNKVSISFAAMVWPTFLYVGSWQKKGLDYLLIIFPVIISYLAVWLSEEDEMKKVKRWIIIGLWLAVLLNIPRLIYKNYLHRQPDTRQLASNWILQNYPSGSRICYDHYHYDLDLIDPDRFLTYGEGSKYLDQQVRDRLLQKSGEIKSIRYISAQKKMEQLAVTDSLYSKVGSDTFLLQAYRHPHRSLEEIKSAGAELLILNSDSYLRFINHEPPSPENPLMMDFIQRQSFYQQVLDSLTAVKIFSPSKFNPGPTIRIYDLMRH